MGDDDLVTKLETLGRLSEVLLWVLVVLFLVVAGIFFLDGIKPRRVVERARRLRGVDLLANVVDESRYFRFLRRQKFCLAGVVLVIGLMVTVEGFSRFAELEAASLKGTEALLEMKATTLWLEQQRLAPQAGPSLEDLQSQLVEVQEAYKTESPDRDERLEALQKALQGYLEGAGPQMEVLGELGETLEELEQVREKTGSSNSKEP